MLDVGTLLLRIVIGALLGGVIGYEREREGHAAGLRTHFLVGLAAALYVIVSGQFAYHQNYDHDTIIHIDMSRIASLVVSGIGFLAGGTILKTGLTIQGLTTAAALWLVTAIGMAAGAGLQAVAFGSTVLGLISLRLLRRFEGQRGNKVHLRLLFEAKAPPEVVARFVSRVGEWGVTVKGSAYSRDLKHAVTRGVLELEIPRKVGESRVVAELEAMEGIQRFSVKPNKQ